jgi:hypothetical protein
LPSPPQPITRLKKLGIKPDSHVVLLGINDPAFTAEITAGGAVIEPENHIPSANLIFLSIEDAADLERLPALRRTVKSDVAIWTLRRKGRKDLTEAQVMRAGLDAGFVDVKVVSFSDTLTAEKFVIRLADRGKC